MAHARNALPHGRRRDGHRGLPPRHAKDLATGEVVVNLHRNHDVQDLTETMLHEVVAHRGLDEMLGGPREARAFYDEVYDHLATAERERVNAKMHASGYDTATATAEYMGELAQKGFEISTSSGSSTTRPTRLSRSR